MKTMLLGTPDQNGAVVSVRCVIGKIDPKVQERESHRVYPQGPS